MDAFIWGKRPLPLRKLSISSAHIPRLSDSYATVFATQMRSWCIKIQEQGRVISGSSMDCYNVQWDPVHRARGMDDQTAVSTNGLIVVDVCHEGGCCFKLCSTHASIKLVIPYNFNKLFSV